MGLEAGAIAGIVSAVAAAGSAAYGIASAQEAKGDARKERARQQQQIMLQKRMDEARLRRENRIKAARMLASGEGGVEASMVEGAAIGGRVSTEEAVRLGGLQAQNNIAATDYRTETVLNQLDADIAKNIGTIAAETVDVVKSEFLKPLEEPVE